MAFYLISLSRLPFLSHSASCSPTLPCSSVPPRLPFPPCVHDPFLARLLSHSDLNRGSLHRSRSCYPLFPSPLSPYLPSFLSLEENHTLISLPALFLTSRLARRILMKLHSQLTPKAHNNLLCEQTHVHTHVHARVQTSWRNTREESCAL